MTDQCPRCKAVDSLRETDDGCQLTCVACKVVFSRAESKRMVLAWFRKSEGIQGKGKQE